MTTWHIIRLETVIFLFIAKPLVNGFKRSVLIVQRRMPNLKKQCMNRSGAWQCSERWNLKANIKGELAILVCVTKSRRNSTITRTPSVQKPQFHEKKSISWWYINQYSISWYNNLIHCIMEYQRISGITANLQSQSLPGQF